MSTNLPEICVVGSLNMDLIVRVPRRPAAGETLIGDGFRNGLGGKGLNQAVAARRSGASVAMVGRVGNDAYGAQLLASLVGEDIDAAHVKRDGNVSSGVAVILVDSRGENSIVIAPGANGQLSPSDVQNAKACIAASSILVLQCEIPAETLVAAATVARSNGTTVVLNVAPATILIAAFAGLVDIVIVNETEAEALTGIATGGEGAGRAAQKLREESGASGVVLTLGQRGVLVDHGEQQLLSAHRVTCVDTVGAGDAFCGALAGALSRGASLVEAARYGNAAGALAVSFAGAAEAIPTRAAVEALLERTSVG